MESARTSAAIAATVVPRYVLGGRVVPLIHAEQAGFSRSDRDARQTVRVRLNGMRRSRLLTITLAIWGVTASLGWFLSAHPGRGVPPECYSLEAEHALTIRPVHGSYTDRAIFAVDDSSDRVTVGYWEDVAGGPHMAIGYPAELTYWLRGPLEDRPVVDPAGDPIPRC